MGIPSLIQEQNGFAGLTNKKLGDKVQCICVAYEGMEKFFPADKIIMTGNPVRQNLLTNKYTKAEALQAFGYNTDKKTILILGGSLGARTINQTLMNAIETIKNNPDIQVIWQTGKIYIDEIRKKLEEVTNNLGAIPNLFVTDFIKEMDKAYAAADLVISRAGAGSISEFCLLKKPVILVPSPNVAEDHQTKNALALSTKDAAIYVKDAEAQEKLIPVALATVKDNAKLASLQQNIAKLALPNSARIIAQEVLKLVEG